MCNIQKPKAVLTTLCGAVQCRCAYSKRYERCRSLWILSEKVLETRFHESMYLSIHMATHFCSELSSEEPGLLMHFLKHFSDILVTSSWILATAICCLTLSISSSRCAADKFAVMFSISIDAIEYNLDERLQSEVGVAIRVKEKIDTVPYYPT